MIYMICNTFSPLNIIHADVGLISAMIAKTKFNYESSRLESGLSMPIMIRNVNSIIC